jgi:hypothetical protein
MRVKKMLESAKRMRRSVAQGRSEGRAIPMPTSAAMMARVPMTFDAEASGEVAGKAYGEADDGVDVEAEVGRRDIEDDDLPEGEDSPGESREDGELAGCDEVVAGEARTDDGADGDDREERQEDDARDELPDAAFATEGVAEDAPAELGERGELGAALRGGPGQGVGCGRDWWWD